MISCYYFDFNHSTQNHKYLASYSVCVLVLDSGWIMSVLFNFIDYTFRLVRHLLAFYHSRRQFHRVILERLILCLELLDFGRHVHFAKSGLLCCGWCRLLLFFIWIGWIECTLCFQQRLILYLLGECRGKLCYIAFVLISFMLGKRTSISIESIGWE